MNTEFTEKPLDIGQALRNIREKGGHGPIVAVARLVGVDKNTLQGYETGRSLPDVDFLAVFAAKTGADFQELLRLRLASGKTEEARKLSESLILLDEAHRAAQASGRTIKAVQEQLRGEMPGVGYTATVAASMKARVQAVNRDFEEVLELVGWEPPLLVRQAISGAMLFHGLTKEGALYQLQVLAAQAHLDAEQQNTR